MFDLGALGELLLIAIAVLVLFGPKEIPELVKLAGRWAGKLRAVSREVQRSVDSVINEAEIEDYKEKAGTEFQDEIKKNLEKLEEDEKGEE